MQYSLNYVTWKYRKDVVSDLKSIYGAGTIERTTLALDNFEERWGWKLSINWSKLARKMPRIIPFFDYSPEIKKVIYITNTIKSVNMSFRKITKNSCSYPSDESFMKLFYLALRNISQKCNIPIRD